MTDTTELRVGQTVPDASKLPVGTRWEIPGIEGKWWETVGPNTWRHMSGKTGEFDYGPMDVVILELPAPTQPTAAESDVRELGELAVGDHFGWVGAARNGRIPGVCVVLSKPGDGSVIYRAPNGEEFTAHCAKVRRLAPDRTDLAGGSVDAATREDAASESLGAGLEGSTQPPAVCSKCGVPESKYHRLKNPLAINAGRLCLDCHLMRHTFPGHAPQHPSPPADEPGRVGWDVDDVDYFVGGS